MFLRTLCNPFTRIAGFPALFCGCLVMLLTAVLAAPNGVNFAGSLNIHVTGQPMSFALIFAFLILGWLNAAVFFLAAGKIFSKSKIRTVDVFGTLALARAPFLIAAFFGFLPGLKNLDPQMFLQPNAIPAEVAFSLTIFGIAALLVDIWVVVWSYNAFTVSTNVKSKWLFTAVLIVSEIVAVIQAVLLSVLLTVGMPSPPSEKPILQDVEHVEIARKFVARFFADTDDDPLEQFRVTDAMKSFVTADSFKRLAKKFVIDYGKPGDIAKIEIIRHSQQSRRVSLFFHCERHPVVIWVTFDDKTISGFHYDTWREGSTNKSRNGA